MYSLKFYLKDPSANTTSLLYASVYYNGKRCKVSIKQKIYPAFWNHDKQNITLQSQLLRRYEKAHPQIRTQLKQVQATIQLISANVGNYFLKKTIEEENDVSLNEVMRIIKKSISPEDADKAIDFSGRLIPYLEEFIENAKRGRIKQPNSENYTMGTIKNYENLHYTLVRFENSKNKLCWNDIDRSWFSEFIRWHEERGLSKNYTAKHVKDIKYLMKISFEDDIHSNEVFRKSWFSCAMKRSEKFPLNSEEMEMLQNLPLRDGNTECKARDFFLIGCFTGLRVSDIKRLHPTMIHRKDNPYIKIKTKKTQKVVVIPISSKLDVILKRYKDYPPKIATQTVNKKIKYIAKEAGINKIKSQNLTIHIGRYSFATHLYSSGMKMSDIMQLTGHSSESNFFRYIDIKPEETAKRVKEHEFFK